MFKVAIKGLLGHKLRLLLTGFAIVLGISFVSGAYVLTDTLKGSFGTLFGEVNKGVDAVVRAKPAFEGDTGSQAERLPISDSVVAQVRAVEGVDQIAPSVSGVAVLLGKDGKAVGKVAGQRLGFAWDTSDKLRSVKLTSGQEPKAANEIAIDEGAFKLSGYAVGDTVKVSTASGTDQYVLRGVVRFGSSNSLAGATLTFFPFSKAQQVFQLEGKVQQIGVAAKDNVTANNLIGNLSTALPDYEVISGSQSTQEQVDSVSAGLGFFTTFLLIFAGVSLFVGAFLIINTFTIVVAQRGKELALLRALGAKRRQILFSVVLEAFIVGFVMSGVGLVSGIGVAQGLKALFGAIGVDIPSGSLVIKTRTVLTCMITGTVISCGASLLPAFQASRLAPVAALRDEVTIPKGSTKVRTILGLLIAVFSAYALTKGVLQGEGLLIGAGAVALFLGLAALAPLLVKPLVMIFAAPFVKLFGLPAKLGKQNSIRNPRRTASTSSALVIGVSLVVAATVFVSSLQSSFSKLLTDSIKSDFTVSPQDNGSNGMSTKIAELLATKPEFSAVSGARNATFRVGKTDERVIGINPAAIQDLYVQKMVSGSLGDLGLNKVVLEDKYAKSKNLEFGSDFAVNFAKTGPVTLKVVGISKDSGPQGVNVMLSNDTIEANVDSSKALDAFAWIKLAPGVSQADGRKAIDNYIKDFPGIKSFNLNDLKKVFAKAFGQVLGLVYGLLSIAIIIAIFGIINTLVLSIFERTRELGLIRAVGAQRKQVTRMVRSEAVITALLGVLGLGLGLLLSWVGVRALADQGFSSYSIPIPLIFGCIIATPLIGMFAAIWPAWRASRLNVLNAIQQL